MFLMSRDIYRGTIASGTSDILFKFSLDSVDNYVIFTCCARGVTLSKLMLHSLASVLTIKINENLDMNLDMFWHALR